jgi:hypothetical protein
VAANRLLFLLVALPALAGCVTSKSSGLNSADFMQSVPGQAVSQSGTQVKITNPNPTRWIVVPTPARYRVLGVTIFACRPLACAGPASVVFGSHRSPTRDPDRHALEKAAKLLPTQAKAKDLVMDAASEGEERLTSLSSKVTTIRGYPAIIAETKRTSHRKVTYIYQGHLFIGDRLIKMGAISSRRDEAKRNFNEFVAVLSIEDYLPSAPATQPIPDNGPPPLQPSPSSSVSLDGSSAPSPFPNASVQ